MKKILLEITGTQQSGTEKDTVELMTIGTLRDDGSAYIINYTEEENECPRQSTKVSLRIAKDCSYVNLTRSGALNSCLIIEKSTRNQCQYQTHLGNILMGLYGREIEITENNGSGEINFIYDIDFNGAVASKNTVNIKFKNNQEH